MVLYITSSEQFLIDREIENIKIKNGIKNKSDLNYLEPKTIEELESFTNSYSFFDTQKKIALVKNIEDEKMINIFENLPDNIILLIIGDLDKRKKLYKYLKKNKSINELKPLTKKDLTNWVVDVCKSYDMNISLSLASKVLDLTGESDMYNIQNELIKLCMIKQKITSDLIDEVVTKSLVVSSFELTDSILCKDVNKSLQVLDKLLKHNQEMIPLLALINKNFCIIKSLQEINEEYLKDIGINAWVIKQLRPFKNNFTQEKLNECIELCQSLDFDLKNGYDPKIVMERLIFNINN